MKTKRLSKYYPPEPEGMTLRGLSGYVVSEKDGVIHVWSRHCRKEVQPKKRAYPQFSLTRDDGRCASFTPGHLRYLMAHPEVDECSLNLKGMRIKFRDDGTVVDLYEGPRSRTFLVFRDIDDVQRTVDIMREVFHGDMNVVLAFLGEFRDTAVYTVANLLGLSPNTVRPFLEQAEEDFLGELRNANVRDIKPLFSWFCKCLRCACRRKAQKHMRIDTEWAIDRDLRNAAFQPESENW